MAENVEQLTKLPRKKRKKEESRWWEAREHCPDPGRMVVTYSEIHGGYEFGYFCPIGGWRDCDSERIIVTHWLDADIFAFPFKDGIDQAVADKLKTQVNRGKYGK